MSPFPRTSGRFSSILPHVKDCVKLPICGEGLARSPAAVATATQPEIIRPRRSLKAAASCAHSIRFARFGRRSPFTLRDIGKRELARVLLGRRLTGVLILHSRSDWQLARITTLAYPQV